MRTKQFLMAVAWNAHDDEMEGERRGGEAQSLDLYTGWRLDATDAPTLATQLREHLVRQQRHASHSELMPPTVS